MIRPNSVEALENRIAPASILTPDISADGKSATFVDMDGDIFTVTTSKGTFTAANFTYVGDELTGHGYLQRIDVSFASHQKDFQGASIIVTIEQPVGDGFGDVGFVDAAGIDLKEFVTDSDLVRIDVGNAGTKSPAIKLFQAAQFGFTPAIDAGLDDFTSKVTGKINVLNIGDWANAALDVSGKFPEGKSFQSIGRASIGSLTGGAAMGSGSIQAAGGIGSLAIQGNIVGGPGWESALIFAEGKISSVSVGGNIEGGDGRFSGLITSTAGFGTVTIAGSIKGGADELSGSVWTDGRIKTMDVGGDLEAGTGSLSGSIVAKSASKLTVTGKIFGGTRVSGIIVGDVIGKLTIGGTDGTGGRAIIAAEGPDKGGIAIEKLTVTGDLSGARVLAGFDRDLDPTNPNAGIGKIVIQGDLPLEGNLIATDIVAGIDPVNGVFGDGDDRLAANDLKPKHLASIGSIVVEGVITGTDGGTDQYAILAEKIGSVMISGIPLPLGKKTADDVQLGTFGDFRLREIVAVG